MLSRAIRRAYRELIFHQRRQVTFWMLIGFMPTFGLARLIVHLNPHLFVTLNGNHVHHFVYGIAVLIVVGYIALTTRDYGRPGLAAAYGAGVALTLDEFAIWFHLEDLYHARASYDAIVLAGAFFFTVVYFDDFWRLVGHYTKRYRRKS